MLLDLELLVLHQQNHKLGSQLLARLLLLRKGLDLVKVVLPLLLELVLPLDHLELSLDLELEPTPLLS